MRSPEMLVIDTNEIRELALMKKVSAHYDNDTVQAFLTEAGVTADNAAELLPAAFAKVADAQVEFIKALVEADLGLEISDEEALNVLKAVLPAKVDHILFGSSESEEVAEIEVTLVTVDCTDTDTSSLVADLVPEVAAAA